MLTLLTQLELSEVQYLRLLPQLNVTCTLNFHKVGGKHFICICLCCTLFACLQVLMGSGAMQYFLLVLCLLISSNHVITCIYGA